MELISNLAKNHEYDKIDEYIEQMHERIDTFGNLITVQNSIVDAIINQYYARAEQSGVTMEVKGRFPMDCNIDTYDLCTIFSNVLSNALEAALETDEKYVSMENSTWGNRFLRARRTGSSLRHSSSSPTGTEPGRVEHAPISMMSAPSATMHATRSSAASTSAHLLSAKYESSVRLTIPIIDILRPVFISGQN